MYRKHWLLNFLLFSLLAFVTTAAIAMDASLLELLEMSDQIDRSEKQDFKAALDRANACTRARNFACAESELAKAKKVANSGQDKKMLLASLDGLASEKQQLANEKIRAEEERKAQLQREEKARLAQLEEEEEDRRREKRERLKQEEEEFEQALAERASEEQESTRQAWNNVGLEINRKAAENAAILNNINRQTNAAYAETNRRLAAQAAERNRARAEQDVREADRRRDAARKRADTQRLAQVQERDETNARIKREADTARVQQEREQKRIEDERRNQEVRDSMERKRVAEAEAARQKAETAATKLAEQQAELRAQEQYLQAMKNGIRLGVKNCYGQYEVGGTRPKAKEVVSCIDVHYRARCEGSTASYDGIIKNFTGFDAGCFGDTTTISPKPACPADQVHIDVTEVVHGCRS